MFGLGKLEIYAIAGGIIAIAFGLFIQQQREIGRKEQEQAQREKVEQERKNAIEGANDVRRCIELGGVWKISLGRCERS